MFDEERHIPKTLHFTEEDADLIELIREQTSGNGVHLPLEWIVRAALLQMVLSAKGDYRV